MSDPGSLTGEDATTYGVLWFSHNPRMPHTWRYVAPADVERVPAWFDWMGEVKPEAPLCSTEPVPFHRRLQHD